MVYRRKALDEAHRLGLSSIKYDADLGPTDMSDARPSAAGSRTCHRECRHGMLVSERVKPDREKREEEEEEGKRKRKRGEMRVLTVSAFTPPQSIR